MGSNLCVNKKVQALCRNYGARCMLELPYHSQGRGQVERANKTAWGVLLALANSMNKSQAEVINLALFTCNSIMRGYRIDSSAGPIELKKSAYKMTYGHLPNIDDNNLLKAYPNRTDIMKAIQDIRKHVGKLNHKENEENRKAEETQEETLKVGDLVLAR